MLKAALVISFLIPITLFSQNLVPNGGFEEYVDCPIARNHTKIKGIWEYNPTSWHPASCGTPDYFNKCSPSQDINSVDPHSGKGCAGIGSLFEIENTCREYISVDLKSPLVANEMYCVKFYIVLSKESGMVSSFVGAYFSHIRPDVPSGYSSYGYAPQVNNSKPFIFDSVWTEISGIFKAKGGEKILTIGNFISHDRVPGKIGSNIKFAIQKEEHGYPCAYYYIDDVSVTHITNEFECTSIGSPVALNNIFFDTNKSILLPKSAVELDKLAGYLKMKDSLQIDISGHTDSIGNAAANKKLSADRAKAVADYLVSKGVNKKRITYKGLGSSKPVAPNSNEGGRQKNRRVEFLLRKP